MRLEIRPTIWYRVWSSRLSANQLSSRRSYVNSLKSWRRIRRRWIIWSSRRRIRRLIRRRLWIQISSTKPRRRSSSERRTSTRPCWRGSWSSRRTLQRSKLPPRSGILINWWASSSRMKRRYNVWSPFLELLDVQVRQWIEQRNWRHWIIDVRFEGIDMYVYVSPGWSLVVWGSGYEHWCLQEATFEGVGGEALPSGEQIGTIRVQVPWRVEVDQQSNGIIYVPSHRIGLKRYSTRWSVIRSWPRR